MPPLPCLPFISWLLQSHLALSLDALFPTSFLSTLVCISVQWTVSDGPSGESYLTWGEIFYINKRRRENKGCFNSYFFSLLWDGGVESCIIFIVPHSYVLHHKALVSRWFQHLFPLLQSTVNSDALRNSIKCWHRKMDKQYLNFIFCFLGNRWPILEK